MGVIVMNRDYQPVEAVYLGVKLRVTANTNTVFGEIQEYQPELSPREAVALIRSWYPQPLRVFFSKGIADEKRGGNFDNLDAKRARQLTPDQYNAWLDGWQLSAGSL